MTSIAAIVSKLNSQPYSFAELTQEEQAFLANQLRPGGDGFSEDQRSLLIQWRLVVPPDQISQIDALNSDRLYQIAYQTLIDGTHVIGADLLSDIRPGETYSFASQWLTSLKLRQVSVDDFPLEAPDMSGAIEAV